MQSTFKLIVLVFILSFLHSCKSSKSIKKDPTPDAPIGQKESEIRDSIRVNEEINQNDDFIAAPVNIAEFRAAWIATVANINWPSKPGLNSDVQKEEAVKMLDFLAKNNFNAVILQVRPQADALYESELEPWSYFLTGKSGKAPTPYYDPLEFWINEAHKRGLELHVWLNPYRAHHTTGKEIGENSIVKTNPELVIELKNGMWWMDPGSKKVQDHSAAVVRDIVKRYDIDAVHFDDYFYPYASYNGKGNFPDDKSWNSYLKNGGNLSRADWRRKNVNDFIERVAEDIKEEKSFVKFGISPFGIWRPGFPKGISGMDQYEELYADAKLWLNKGWIDYFTPQLYWPTSKVAQSFPVLLGWWESENVVGRHLWPGINLGLEDEIENKGEIASQILISRGILQDNPGTVHWNIGPLMKKPELLNSIINGPYRQNALVPPSPWLDENPPAAPAVKIIKENDMLILNWSSVEPEDVFRWVIYYQYENGNWDYQIVNKETSKLKLPVFNNHGKKLKGIGVNSVDRTGNQSSFREYKIQ
ncbi:glycoside hydrolase family 10 protein [Christiangramia aquimixticola]|uniref:glycoside hydrolase family 10 protein n=1 Tax=Christiangramia aquimixticola TaxID=1697558 RepID=UPI003AA8CA8E